jgi:hypothetical protein
MQPLGIRFYCSRFNAYIATWLNAVSGIWEAGIWSVGVASLRYDTPLRGMRKSKTFADATSCSPRGFCWTYHAAKGSHAFVWILVIADPENGVGNTVPLSTSGCGPR